MTGQTFIKKILYLRFFRWIMLFSTIGFFTGLPFSVHAIDVLVGTKKSGTFSYFTGHTLCRVINNYSDGIRCQVVPAANDLHNLTNLRGGSLDFALVDSRRLHEAVTTTGDFEFLDIGFENLRVLFLLYDVPITLAARPGTDIHELDDLKGKRINTGDPDSPEREAVNTILKLKNWTKKDFSMVENIPLTQFQSIREFCHGVIQAQFFVGIHPDPVLGRIFKMCKARLIPMNDPDIQEFVDDHPAYVNIQIPPNIYPEVSGAVETFGTLTVLATTVDLDTETIYKVMDLLYSHRKEVKRAHPVLSSFSADNGRLTGKNIRAHPVAAEYMEEKGKKRPADTDGK